MYLFIGVAAISVATAFHTFIGSHSNGSLSDFDLANVDEVLARNEDGCTEAATAWGDSSFWV